MIRARKTRGKQPSVRRGQQSLSFREEHTLSERRKRARREKLAREVESIKRKLRAEGVKKEDGDDQLFEQLIERHDAKAEELQALDRELGIA